MRFPSVMSRDRVGLCVAFTLLGGATVALASTIAVGYAPIARSRLGWAEPTRSAYSPGGQLDLPRTIYGSSQQTLVAFASALCGASVRSAPALARLAGELRDSQTRFVLVTPNGSMMPDQEAFVEGLRLAPSEHDSLELSRARVKTIPAVVLVNRSGRVLYSREGLLDEAAMSVVLKAIEDGLR